MRAFFAVLEDRKRAEGAGIEARLEAVAHGKNYVDGSGRFGGRGDFALAAGNVHADFANSGGDQMPLGGIDVAASIWKQIVGTRAVDLHGRGTDGVRGRRLLRRQDGRDQDDETAEQRTIQRKFRKTGSRPTRAVGLLMQSAPAPKIAQRCVAAFRDRPTAVTASNGRLPHQRASISLATRTARTTAQPRLA